MKLDSCLQAGLDSLGAVELRNALRADFGIEVPATLAFDYPTIKAIAGFVIATLGPQPALMMEYGLHSPASFDKNTAFTTEILAAGCRYPGCSKGEKNWMKSNDVQLGCCCSA